MASSRFPIPQGTLDMLILHILSLGPAHGYAIAQRLQQISRETVQRQSGLVVSSAAPPRTEKRWLKSAWRQSETGPRGQVLCAHARGPQAAGRREGELGSVDDGGPADLQRGHIGVAKLLNLFRRRRDQLERDLDRELRYHMDRRVEDLIKDGLSEPEARRRASIELGGVPQVQEAVRDTWIWRWLDALVRDVRYAVRSLTRSWGFALGAGAVLALAIGATTAIFSVVNTVLLQPLAYPDAERLVSIETLVDRHRTRQPGRVRSRLSRLAGSEQRVREDGGVVQQHRRSHHRWRRRRVWERRVRLG